MEWVRKSKDLLQSDLKLVKFQEWLENLADDVCQLQNPFPSNSKYEQKQGRKFEHTYTTTEIAKKTKGCVFCNEENHHLSKCSSFSNINVDKRWDFVNKRRLCFSCLYSNHGFKECTRKKSCQINGCQKVHNSLLHREFPENKELTQNDVSHSDTRHFLPHDSERTVETNCHIFQEQNQVVLKILPVQLSNRNKVINTYALLDDASTKDERTKLCTSEEFLGQLANLITGNFGKKLSEEIEMLKKKNKEILEKLETNNL
ncbi:hypothetical protein JTB14_002011 [Gonioctena quinquepunctata]|nr:hypothetical protein JTB14_002011 [Gonioctena quinquepunctata]